MDRLGGQQHPFLFILDFSLKENIVLTENELNGTNILFYLNGITNQKKDCKTKVSYSTNKLKKYPLSFDEYKKAFDRCLEYIRYGDTYLLNLTFPSKITMNIGLEDIFYHANSKYRLLLPKKFVCFSPETFVQIRRNKITTFPMKGTLKASTPNAKNTLLNNLKEACEHTTIVDLMRNDLNQISSGVVVKSFRNIEKISSQQGDLLQMVSKITGKLPSNYNRKIGKLIFKLLPAGSISGAPKKKTLEVIDTVEKYNRGYYTGIFGYFDGENLDSSVMIRFIEKIADEYYFKSGGGITYQSDVKEEYEELIDKIYLPF